jgi:protein TonB
MRVIGRLTAAVMMLAWLAAAGYAQDSTQLPRQNDPGVTPPAVLKDVKPVYTEAAKEAGVQGTVELEAVVLTDGTVGDITITKSLDRKYGLDEEAFAALKQWRFTPGKKDGKTVPVLVTIEMTFTLR